MAKYILVDLDDLNEQIKDTRKQLKTDADLAWGPALQEKLDSLVNVREEGKRLTRQINPVLLKGGAQ